MWLRFFPVGLLYFLTVPFPWQFGGLRQNFTIPETFVWVCSYPLVSLRVLPRLPSESIRHSVSDYAYRRDL